MTAVMEQPALFPVIEPGAHVKVFHEGGDLEGCGMVVACIWSEGGGELRNVLVSLYAGGLVLLRPAARVVLNEDVMQL